MKQQISAKNKKVVNEAKNEIKKRLKQFESEIGKCKTFVELEKAWDNVISKGHIFARMCINSRKEYGMI